MCAVNDRISQANVTSTKSSSSRKCRNDDKIELWKSFHLRAYCCSDGDGETARSIFVVVVLLFSVVCNSVDSVISFGCKREWFPYPIEIRCVLVVCFASFSLSLQLCFFVCNKNVMAIFFVFNRDGLFFHCICLFSLALCRFQAIQLKANWFFIFTRLTFVC